MKKGDVIRQKCVNTTFYLTGILAHKVNNYQNSLNQCPREFKSLIRFSKATTHNT